MHSSYVPFPYYTIVESWESNLCLCLTGKRIPVADAAGGTSGKGFKLGRQASESRRTCC